MVHSNTIIPETIDPLQFAYCPNRSTDDTISIALYIALSHQDKRNTYVKMLFIDYSSEFSTIVPSKLITKLRILGLNTSLCNWILDFLTDRLQVVTFRSLAQHSTTRLPCRPEAFSSSGRLASLATHLPC